MKNITTIFLLFLLFRLPLAAQTPCWVEEFNSSQGWTLEENWTVAGGLLQFYWTPTILNFDLSATSPLIPFPETVQELIVNQYLDVFGWSSPPEVAEISVIVQGEPFVLWSYELSNDNWGQTTGSDLVLDISNFAGQTGQIKFRTYGPTTYQWNWWNVFNMRITAMYENDLTITGITGPAAINPDETGTWNIAVKNLGSSIQSDYTLNLFSLKNYELIASVDISENINPQETKNLNIEWTPETAYNTVLRGEIVLENDQYPDNNISKGHFVRIKPNIEFSVLLWDYDNSIETITDPEIGDAIQPSTGLERVLQAAGIEYDFVNYLPNNLNDYEMIFSTMGCFCVD